MPESLERLLALPARAVIELFGTGGALSLGGASVLFVALLAYLTRPRAAYLAFPAYGEGPGAAREFALLVMNMDAAPLGKRLSFAVHAEQITAVRAFPCHAGSRHVEVSRGAEAGTVDVTIRDMAEEDSLMLVFEHTQPRAVASFQVGAPTHGPERVVPRQWGPLPELTLRRRIARAVLRITPGIIMFVATYAILRGGFSYPSDVEARKYPVVSWDTAIITIGVIGCAVAYWMSSMDKGRQLAIPSEAHGTSVRMPLPAAAPSQPPAAAPLQPPAA